MKRATAAIKSERSLKQGCSSDLHIQISEKTAVPILRARLLPWKKTLIKRGILSEGSIIRKKRSKKDQKKKNEKKDPHLPRLRS